MNSQPTPPAASTALPVGVRTRSDHDAGSFSTWVGDSAGLRNRTNYSYDPALKDSHLIADSYAPRVAIRSFAEQFTEFFTGHGTRALNPAGALKFEGSKGGAIEWQDPKGRSLDQSLPLKDKRRWKIIEEALRCAEIGVKYGSDITLGVFPTQWAKLSKESPSFR